SSATSASVPTNRIWTNRSICSWRTPSSNGTRVHLATHEAGVGGGPSQGEATGPAQRQPQQGAGLGPVSQTDPGIPAEGADPGRCAQAHQQPVGAAPQLPPLQVLCAAGAGPTGAVAGG